MSVNKVFRTGYRSLNQIFSEKIDFEVIPPRIKYDDIVDKTDYIPDSELIRQNKVSGAATTKGLYDFNSESDLKTKNISPVEVMLRNPSQNLIDRADIPALMDAIKEDAKTKADKKRAEDIAEKNAKVQKLRDKRIDEMLGVSDLSNE